MLVYDKPKAISVTQLNNVVKNKLEGDPSLNNVFVEGEISGWKINSSGHVYFTLKDNTSRVNCALFAYSRRSLTFMPKDGDKVGIIGRVSIYAPSGSYQLIAEMLVPYGKGDLHELYEKLKKKLTAEGLFDQKKKKTIPRLPKAIGVITSPTGAAVHDIIRVTHNRHKGMKIYLYPAKVQGDDATRDLINGLRFFNSHPLVDVIIIGRGGGSYEDLWCFNDETLVRCIAASAIPVVSAVGHETDFTLSDFASDIRAATPSNAAELVVPDLDADLRRLDNLKERIEYCFNDLFVRLESEWGNADHALHVVMASILNKFSHRFEMALSGLDRLSPLKVMARGYSVASVNGNIIKSVKDVYRDGEMETVLLDGKIISIVQEVKNG